ncbi:hypothetical protein DFJ73DRAFT_936857 [Zopfochytrium polystomum]|nr:hypothetical protein DFJ73DRAFT_936857 [Zopfochytrium polystomum]
MNADPACWRSIAKRLPLFGVRLGSTPSHWHGQLLAASNSRRSFRISLQLHSRHLRLFPRGASVFAVGPLAPPAAVDVRRHRLAPQLHATSPAHGDLDRRYLRHHAPPPPQTGKMRAYYPRAQRPLGASTAAYCARAMKRPTRFRVVALAQIHELTAHRARSWTIVAESRTRTVVGRPSGTSQSTAAVAAARLGAVPLFDDDFVLVGGGDLCGVSNEHRLQPTDALRYGRSHFGRFHFLTLTLFLVHLILFVVVAVLIIFIFLIIFYALNLTIAKQLRCRRPFFVFRASPKSSSRGAAEAFATALPRFCSQPLGVCPVDGAEERRASLLVNVHRPCTPFSPPGITDSCAPDEPTGRQLFPSTFGRASEARATSSELSLRRRLHLGIMSPPAQAFPRAEEESDEHQRASLNDMS